MEKRLKSIGEWRAGTSKNIHHQKIVLDSCAYF